MSFCRTVLLLMLVETAYIAQTPPASVEGTVVELGTNTPLSKATLDLRSVTDTAVRYPAVTSDNGRFVIRNIPPGQYTVSASRTGYVRSQYGQRGPNGNAAILTVEPGKSFSGVRISMMPSAAISGRVSDREGAAVANAQMHAWRVSYKDGQRVLIPVVSQITNDLGEYRLFGLPAGQYYVSAQPEPPSYLRSPVYASLAPPAAGAVVISTSAGLLGGIRDPATAMRSSGEYAPVYFGGADEFSATPIDVRAGSDVGGIDILVDRRPLSPMMGVVNGPAGQPMAGATVVITPLAANLGFTTINALSVLGGVLSVVPGMPARTDGNGRFNMTPKPPGSYLLTAIVDQQGRRLAGQMAVDIRGTDRPNVTIVVAPSPELQGRIMFDGPAGDPSRLTVRLTSTVTAIVDAPPATPSASGSFTIRNLAPGNYVLSVTPLSSVMGANPGSVPADLAGAYVKSARMGNIDLLSEGLRIDRLDVPPDRPIEIVIAWNSAQISGVVAAESREILPNVQVVLLPDESRRNRLDLYRATSTDGSGRYRFERVPPGRYKVVAWEDVETNSWYNPAFMRLYEDRGRPVSVAEGTQATQDLTAIPPR